MITEWCVSSAEMAERMRSRLGDEPYRRLTAKGAGLALDEVVELAARH